MATEWSEKQREIINSRNQTLLVSAAAGSGKTAVLVERILSRICDENGGVDADRFLVVTFTNAAAAQMRERLGAAMEERLESLDEGDRLYARLGRQQTLLHNAQISTIHQFCLNIIRNHFNAIELDPSFRVADEGELKLLKSDVVKELLEEYYAEGRAEFFDLVESICPGKNDNALEEIILKMYEASVSHPDPAKWLSSCTAAYETDTAEDFSRLPEILYLMEYKNKMLESLRGIWSEGYAAALAERGPVAYAEVFLNDKRILDALSAALTYTDFVEAWRRLKDGFVTLPRIKAALFDKELCEKAKKSRDTVKTEIRNLADRYFTADAEAAVNAVRRLKPRAALLTELTDRFTKLFAWGKREKNLVDFNDLEHFALRILTREENGEMVYTAAADEYSRFFEEIMVDEYQDSNMVQEALLEAVSGRRFGRENLFMVGDVKQSIYKFRMARPDIFLKKYKEFSRAEDADCRCIELSKNYRSRSEVLSGVNAVFGGIMNKDFGGIEYNDEQRLNPGLEFAEGVPEEELRSEILLIDRQTEDGDKADFETAQMEAKVIAGRIRELTDGRSGFKVWDRRTKEYRRAGYGDIVILLRSFAGRADTYVKVLSEEGIPASAQSGTGYFDAYEVKTMIHFLRILNNPTDDISLAAVLHSPIGGFSSEELALLRIECREDSLYDALLFYEKAGGRQELIEKVKAFRERFDTLRGTVPYTPLHRLIRNALKITGYGDFCEAMPAGNRRKLNLDMLVEKAAAYENTSYRGLFNFVRYLDKLKKYEIDYGEASAAAGENEDVVRIMTIHKSKGLEFPVVILGGAGRRFNQQDSSENIILHSDYGIGMDLVDTKRRTKTDFIKKTVMQRIIRTENLEEEVRVLYVALTRAIEKLVIVGCFANLDKKCENWRACKGDFSSLVNAGCYADWIMPFANERDFSVTAVKPEDITAGEQKRLVVAGVREGILLDKDKDEVFDADFRRLIRERFAYSYEQKASTGVHAAVSVSELKKLSYVHEDDDSTFIVDMPEPVLPRFIYEEQEERADMGMQVGTAYHTVLEQLDFTRMHTEEDIRWLCRQLELDEKLEPAAAKRLKPERLKRFTESALYGRMSRAAVCGLLKKEQPFVIGMDSGEVRGDWPEGELIMVQGIIDAFFEEEGGLVLVDYKTDRVEHDAEQTLINRYKKQFELYERALSQLTGKTVKEKLIYSLWLGKEILVK